MFKFIDRIKSRMAGFERLRAAADEAAEACEGHPDILEDIRGRHGPALPRSLTAGAYLAAVKEYQKLAGRVMALGRRENSREIQKSAGRLLQAACAAAKSGQAG